MAQETPKTKVTVKTLTHDEASRKNIPMAEYQSVTDKEQQSPIRVACEDEVIPLQDRIETVVDDADLEDVYNTERHLLYVACTRARDHLLVTSGDTPSEFLDDMRR